jgi:hypothetical protein
MKDLKNVRFVFFLILLALHIHMFPDATGYSEKKLMTISDKRITVVHKHDWTESTKKARWKMFLGDQNPFTKKNNYASLGGIDNNSHYFLFKSPTPALTYLFISEDSKFIIGLSNIKLLNPVQLVLFDIGGNLLFYTSISVDEAKMSPSEFSVFEKKYPRDASKLKRLKRIYHIGDFIYINCGTIPPLSERAWDYLYAWNGPSHLSKNFTESVTNFVDWYKEPDPEIQLKYENGTVSSISLLDPARERFEIEIKNLKIKDDKK